MIGSRDALLLGSIARLLRDPALTWQVMNGVGFLRTSIRRSADEMHSIELWHPSLRAPDMEDSGMLHALPFDFEQVVLLGAVHDTEIVSLVPTNDATDAYQIHEVGPTMAVTELPERYQLVTSKHTYQAGAIFRYQRGKFRQAEVRALTVTVCSECGDLRGGGRVLARVDHKPVHISDGWGNDRFHLARALREEAATLLLDRARQ